MWPEKQNLGRRHPRRVPSRRSQMSATVPLLPIAGRATGGELSEQLISPHRPFIMPADPIVQLLGWNTRGYATLSVPKKTNSGDGVKMPACLRQRAKNASLQACRRGSPSSAYVRAIGPRSLVCSGCTSRHRRSPASREPAERAIGAEGNTVPGSEHAGRATPESCSSPMIEKNAGGQDLDVPVRSMCVDLLPIPDEPGVTPHTWTITA